ncbi:MAG: enoyl-CoA hydratase-related protein [Sphingomonadales bacterium]|nr:enoyl-CoA hydratase-related protein [Sphingomonadales bacterium]
MPYDTITFEVSDSVGLLTLNRPDSLNAINWPLLDDIGAVLSLIEGGESGVRCLLLTGAGRGFCSGADLSRDDLSAVGPDRDIGLTLEQKYNPVFKRLRALPVPLVTAVNGAAAGAGMSLALAGDIVIAARSAYFLQAFVNIGLIPDAGSTYVVPRLVGKARALAMMMLGEKVPAELARDWGMIYEVTEDDALMDRARQIASSLAAGPTVALGHIRTLINASSGNSYADQLDLERAMQKAAGRTEDFVEGVSAFAQKRKAEFKGR